MMRVTNHGGRCCGVKHINGFSYRPADMVAALPARPIFHGPSCEMLNPAKDFFPGPEPMETGEARLVKLLAYVDKHKPSHLVEVILNSEISNNWKKTLEEHGFNIVTKFQNSNTASTLHVYHRVTPLPKQKKEEIKQ